MGDRVHERFSIRVSSAQKKLWAELAKIENITMAEWIRQSCDLRAQDQLYPLRVLFPLGARYKVTVRAAAVWLLEPFDLNANCYSDPEAERISLLDNYDGFCERIISINVYTVHEQGDITFEKDGHQVRIYAAMLGGMAPFNGLVDHETSEKRDEQAVAAGRHTSWCVVTTGHLESQWCPLCEKEGRPESKMHCDRCVHFDLCQSQVSESVFGRIVTGCKKYEAIARIADANDE